MEPQRNNFKIVTSKKSRVILPNMLTLMGVCVGLTSIKFSNDLSFQSLVFDGFGHNPEDFGKRFEGALNFLLKNN